MLPRLAIVLPALVLAACSAPEPASVVPQRYSVDGEITAVRFGPALIPFYPSLVALIAPPDEALAAEGDGWTWISVATPWGDVAETEPDLVVDGSSLAAELVSGGRRGPPHRT